MIDRVLILAGGLGICLRPLTDSTPQPLLPLKGKPIVQHTIEQLRKYGVKKIILPIGYEAQKIQEYFNWRELGKYILYSLESSSSRAFW